MSLGSEYFLLLKKNTELTKKIRTKKVETRNGLFEKNTLRPSLTKIEQETVYQNYLPREFW